MKSDPRSRAWTPATQAPSLRHCGRFAVGFYGVMRGSWLRGLIGAVDLSNDGRLEHSIDAL
jgi:hypothetical protein